MKRADDDFGRAMDEVAREGDFKHWRLTIRRSGEETQTHVVFGRGEGEGEVCLTFLEGPGGTDCRAGLSDGAPVEAGNDDERQAAFRPATPRGRLPLRSRQGE